MNVLDNIERIEAPAPDVFRREYVLKQKPVIITNLFDGQPIRDITTEEAARASLGKMKIGISEEYVTSFLKSLQQSTAVEKPVENNYCTLEEYLAFVNRTPDTRKMCIEYPLPMRMRAYFQTPSYCKDDSDAMFALFVGNRGNVAHLHFDGDQRQVLLYQVFGTKRVILIHPRASKKLNPLRNFSSFFIENFSEQEKESFVKYTDAYECLLYPGETIFMPALIWHYLEYNDNAMSFNMRYGRNKYNRFLSENFLKDMYLQNISARMIDEEEVEAKYLPVIKELEEASRATYRNEYEKYKHIQSLLQDIYARICTDSIQGMYSFTNLESLVERMMQNEVREQQA